MLRLNAPNVLSVHPDYGAIRTFFPKLISLLLSFTCVFSVLTEIFRWKLSAASAAFSRLGTGQETPRSSISPFEFRPEHFKIVSIWESDQLGAMRGRSNFH